MSSQRSSQSIFNLIVSSSPFSEQQNSVEIIIIIIWKNLLSEFRSSRRGEGGDIKEKFTLLMFGIRLPVKYAVESWMSPWIVHQSYQGSAPGCSGVLHQVGRAPLQRYTEVGLRRG